MYARKKFDEREAEYSVLLQRKLEEAEAMFQHLAPSRSRSIALTKLDEALFWANVGISEAGLEQDYTAVPRNRGFDFDDALKSGLVTVDLQKLLHRKKRSWGRTARPTIWPNWNCWRGLRRTGIMP